MTRNFIKYVFSFVAAGFFVSCTNKGTDYSSEPVKAIPIDAFAIVKLNQFNNTGRMLQETVYWKKFLALDQINELNRHIHFIDSVTGNHESLLVNISKSPVYLSFHTEGKNSAGYILYLPLKKPMFDDLRTIQADLVNRKVLFDEKEYNSITIITAHLSGNKEICYAVCDDIFLLSPSSSLIEKALRQMNQPVSLLSDTSFTRIFSTSGKKVDGNIYINMKRGLSWFSVFFSVDFKKNIRSSGIPHEWTSLDIIIKNDQLMLSGLSLTNGTNRQFINLFQKQEPQEPTVISILPNTISCFMFMGFPNPKLFAGSYHQYLNYNNKLGQYTGFIKDFNNKYNIDAERTFLYNSSGESCIAYSVSNDSSIYYIQKTADKETFISDLRKMLPDEKKRKEKIANQTTDIYILPNGLVKGILPYYFIKPNFSYAAFVDQFFVVSSSYENIKEFIYLSLSGNKLIYNKNFETFNKNIPGKSNLFIYSDICRSQHFFTEILKENIDAEWIKCFGQSNGACIQMSAVENGMFYTNILFQFFEQNATGLNLAWKCRLDTLSTMQPVRTINHISRQAEFVLQDLKKILYLIDANGRILWKKSLPETIMGTIHQLDFYKNNKLQYIFNTGNYLHIIDRNGDYVDRFPVRLKSPATNPLTLIDYDNTKEYRIFISLKDMGLVCLTKEGKTVEGWNITRTNSPVVMPVQYFRLGDKDYLVFSDNQNLFFLNRKGESRFKPSSWFKASNDNLFFSENKTPVSAEHFITTDSLGNIKLIYTDGHIETFETMISESHHYFDYQDFNMDGVRDYILYLPNSIRVYNQNKKLISSINVDLMIDNKPIFYKFDTLDIKMQLYSLKDQKIQLINTREKLWYENDFHTGSCGLIYKTNNMFYIMVNRFDQHLYNYLLQ